MLEQIQCKTCGEYAEVQIFTEQYYEILCFDCLEKKEAE
jgi:formylmethanofuran dehydrogenase subunit E